MKTWSTPASFSFKGQAFTHTTGLFFIPAHLFKDQSLSCDVMAATLVGENKETAAILANKRGLNSIFLTFYRVKMATD